jgi:hypothetical protein
MSTDSGSNYNVTKTTTSFRTYHYEGSDELAAVGYVTDFDLAQSTAFQPVGYNIGSGSDESLGGLLQLFNPSSTTYVKHFISTTSFVSYDDAHVEFFSAGYGNTTSAVNAIRFQMSSGNMDGIIKLYGVKKS